MKDYLYEFQSRSVYEPYLCIKHYKDDDWRLIMGKKRKKGYESTCKSAENNIDASYSSSESERCSLSRAKSEIIDICRSNEFAYFVTLTVSSNSCDRFSLSDCQDKLLSLLKEYQRRSKREQLSFKYIIVTEKHENGAYHFHGLFTCLIPDDIILNKNDYPTSKFFSEKLGYFSFSKIRNHKRCSFYISKYINKCPIKSETNQLYFCSKGLRRAEAFLLPLATEDYAILRGFWGFENDYVKIKDFNFEKLPSYLQLFFLNKKEI